MLLQVTYTLHPAPYTLHPTPCTMHPAPYSLLPTPLHRTPPYILNPSDAHGLLLTPFLKNNRSFSRQNKSPLQTNDAPSLDTCSTFP